MLCLIQHFLILLKLNPKKIRLLIESQLNQTGPEPFKVEYYAFVEDEDYLEQRVHQYLALNGLIKTVSFFHRLR